MKIKSNNKWVEHIDSSWIDKKIGGHGGAYSFDNPKGVVIIDFIFGKNFLQIFYYNVILYIKYLLRKFN